MANTLPNALRVFFAACAGSVTALASAVPATPPEQFLQYEEAASRPIGELTKLIRLASPICQDKNQYYRGQLPYVVPRDLERASTRSKKIAQVVMEKYGAQPGEGVFLQDQPGTPYGSAGVKKGDKLVAVNQAQKPEQVTESAAEAGSAIGKAAEGVEAASTQKTLVYMRGGQELLPKPEAVAIRSCPAFVSVLDSKYLYAETEPHFIYITYPLLETLDNEELLIVLAHEYSHLVLGHAAKRSGLGPALGKIIFGKLASIGENVETHRQAYTEDELIESDRLTLWFLTRLDIAPKKFENLLLKLEAKAESWGRPDYVRTRPLMRKRMETLRSAITNWEATKVLPEVIGIDTDRLKAMATSVPDNT